MRIIVCLLSLCLILGRSINVGEPSDFLRSRHHHFGGVCNHPRPDLLYSIHYFGAGDEIRSNNVE